VDEPGKTMNESQGTVVVTFYGPVDLPGNSEVFVEALPDGVRLDVFGPKDIEQPASTEILSYEQYEELRQRNPQIKYPDLRKPEQNGVRPNNFPQPGKPGNTEGLIVPKTAVASGGVSSNPPLEAETEEEQLYSDWLKEAAEAYTGEMSDAFHEFSDTAMSVGGDVALVGGGIATVGGLLVFTGIGAPLGAILIVAGGAFGVVGGVVTAIGGSTSGVTHMLDALDEAVENNEAIDAITPALLFGVGAIENVAGKKIPGGKGGGKGGGYTKKKARNDPRCKLLPYSKNKSKCLGETPHHVVPDHVFKEKGKGDYYPNTPKHADGLTICLAGAKKSTAEDGAQIKKKDFRGRLREYVARLAAHGRVHARLDGREFFLGRTGTPAGTTTLEKMEREGARAVAKETGCDQKDLEKQLREFHGSSPYNLSGDTLVRANPFGRISGKWGLPDPPVGTVLGRPDQKIIGPRD
jgi:hypothetical protein